ncbi:MAG: hypothetical protein IKS20_12195 [Victivallales bacterium]|nr:hypothetical protein [Victivallales bacterium]
MKEKTTGYTSSSALMALRTATGWLVEKTVVCPSEAELPKANHTPVPS